MLFLIGLVVGVAVGIVFDDKIKPKIVAVYNAAKAAIKG